MHLRDEKPRHARRRTALFAGTAAALAALALGAALVALPVAPTLAPASEPEMSRALVDAPADAVSASADEPTSPRVPDEPIPNADGSYTDAEGRVIKDEKVVGDVIVTADPGEALPEEGSELAGATVESVEIVADVTAETTAKITLSDGSATDAAMAELESAGLEAQPNFVYHLLEDVETPLASEESAASGADVEHVTNDSLSTSGKLYHLKPYASTDPTDLKESGANVEAAWDVARTNKTVMVATIDTGCYVDHPDLKGVIDTEHMTDVYYNPTNPKPGTMSDTHGHGTHVAGIVASVADNGIGTAGTSYNAMVLPIKVFDSRGGGSTSTEKMVAAYNYLEKLIKDGELPDLHVINMSLGGYGEKSDVDKALEALINRFSTDYRILTVCAGGNGDSYTNKPYTDPSYPSDYAATLSVTALTQNGDDAAWSDYNENKDISAPGIDIYSTYNDGSYVALSGTSMASPLVAGITSMIFAEVPGVTPAEVINYVKTTAQRIPATSRHHLRTSDQDHPTGSAGAIDAAAALKMAMVDKGVVAGEDYFIKASDVKVGVDAKVEYTGEYITPTVTVTHNGVALTQGEDYEVIFSKNLKPGTATVQVHGTGKYGGYVDTHFEIWIPEEKRISIAQSDITVSGYEDHVTYANTFFTPEPTIKQKEELLVLGEDYELSYENNKNASNGKPAKIIIKGIGVYKDTREVTFTIDQADGWMLVDSVAYGATIELVGGGKAYDEHILSSPEMTFTAKSESDAVAKATVRTEYQNLIKVNYNYIHIEPQGAGTTTVWLEVNPNGNYKPVKAIEIKIRVLNPSMDLSNATMAEVEPQPYTGEMVKPKPAVRIAEKTLKEGEDFTYRYTNCKDAGTGYVYADGKGLYTGTISRSFRILPATATISVNPAQLKLASGATGSVSVAYKGQAGYTPIIEAKNPSPDVVDVDFTSGYPTSVSVHAKQSGTAIVKLAAQQTANYTAADTTLVVIVDEAAVHVQQVAVTPSDVSLKVGESAQLSAKITPENAVEQTVEWSVAPGGVASVDATGKVTALSAGDTTVTAKVGSVQATCQVKVSGGSTDPTFSIDRAIVYHVNSSYVYTGSQINPIPELWLNGKRLEKTQDYTLQYAENKNVGTGYIYAYGTGSYAGQKAISFDITPAPTDLVATPNWTGDLTSGDVNWIDVDTSSATIAASSNNSGTAKVSVAGKRVNVTAGNPGTATITITGTKLDANHMDGTTTVNVTVVAKSSGGGTPGGSGTGGSSGSGSSGSPGSGTGGSGSGSTPAPSAPVDPPKEEPTEAEQGQQEIVTNDVLASVNEDAGDLAEVKAEVKPGTAAGDSSDVTWTITLADEKATSKQVADGPVAGIVKALQKTKATKAEYKGNAALSITLDHATPAKIEAFCQDCVNEALKHAASAQAADQAASELSGTSFELTISWADGSTATHTLSFRGPGGSTPSKGVPVYRLYNPFDHSRLLTKNKGEYDNLDRGGWDGEGVIFWAPETSDQPIYRLYNSHNGDHHYTTSKVEYDDLSRQGWTGEGEAFYSFKKGEGVKPIYRLWNPYQKENGGLGSHLYTNNDTERAWLKGLGWHDEGIAWYAITK